jgi:hypothetical protein
VTYPVSDDKLLSSLSTNTPTKPIITIPMSIYRAGNGDDMEEGGGKPYLDKLQNFSIVGSAFHVYVPVSNTAIGYQCI